MPLNDQEGLKPACIAGYFLIPSSPVSKKKQAALLALSKAKIPIKWNQNRTYLQ